MAEKEENTTMTSSMALKVAKKELRTLMKQKLSNIPPESVDLQSKIVTLVVHGS